MRRLRSILSASCAIMIAGVMVVASFTSEASAAATDYCNYSRSIGGRTECYGYFTNVAGYANGIYLDDVIEGGLDAASVNTLAEFIAFYKNNLYGSSTSDATGAAFVILTMMGVQGPNAGGSVSAGIAKAKSMFSLWEARVTDYTTTSGYSINFNYSYVAPQGYANSARLVTSGGADRGDIVYHMNDAATFPTVRFVSPGGVTQALIRRNCSNMIGATTFAQPDAQWALSGSTTVSDATVEPGQSITFSHYVKNNGPDTASGASYDTDVSGGIGTAKPTTAMSDIASGATINVYNDTVTVPANASIGAQYCQNVGYTPQSSSNTARATGASVCATVIRTWKAVGTLTVSDTTATPGQTVVFTSVVKNNGPHDTDPAKTGIDWTTYTTNSTGGNPTNPVSGTPSDYTSGQQRTVRTENFSIPSTALPGTMYCRVLGWTPQSSTDATEGRTGPVCVTVIYDYELVPVADSSASAVPTDTTVTFSYSATKTGTNTNLTSLATRRIVIPATAVLPADWSLVHDNASCATYTAMAAGVICQDIATSDPRALIASDRSRKFTGASTVLTANDSETIPPLTPVGTRICRVLTLDSYDETSAPHNRDSAIACVTVSKAPYMALVGADGSAGGQSIQPCTGEAGFTGAAGATYGSFGEYGLFATGPIKDFSSTALLGSKSLTFANSGVTMPPATEPLGYYQSAHCIGDYALLYASRANATGAVTAWGGSLAATSTDYRLAAANITVPASTIGVGKRYLIYAPNSTVQITGNISYATSGPTLKTFADAPSFVIVAKIITIDASVTKVDGMLFAKQYLNTCTEAGANPNNNKPAIVNDGICKQALIVNGAVVSGGLVLPRTRGGLTVGEPAEIFRMRPEVFLQPYSYAGSGVEPSLVTDYEQELPPRY